MSMSLMVLITSLYKVATGWLVRAVYGGSLHNVGVRLLYLPSLARMSFLWSYMGKKNWYDRVDDTVILGALPFRSQTKELVEREKVTATISVNEWYEIQFFTNNKKEWEAHGVTQHWFETVDFQPPSLDNIREGLEVINQVKASGNSVYLHCKAGKGRSAVVAACYLIKDRNLSVGEAIDFLRSKRPQISINKFQRQRVTEFLELSKTKSE
ncbi:Phosphatidylglycerophosphatase and protein-tyrosine phosphatase 1 [Geodia barretti]|uniref:Phosphatidylglycerophosphatase and protein-tyrosine phosphatase 1 n=1 Tax=Geodia barretti TaxID=519541 RepID=A0AA35RZ52_GEOBA|nr:Phosphatidylglycerophosphatase and protein-tyrosine phosphatase 1 [Geodia barretti]